MQKLIQILFMNARLSAFVKEAMLKERYRPIM
jgi:hypothetical protein